MIEFVDQATIKDFKAAYTDGGAFVLNTFDDFKDKIWDLHFNYRRWKELVTAASMPTVTLHAQKRELDFKYWYYKGKLEIHVEDDVDGPSDLVGTFVIEGLLAGVPQAINDTIPGPIGVPGINDYSISPYEIHPIAPKVLDLRYYRDGFHYPTPGYESVGSDTVRYLDDTTTTSVLVDEEVTDYLVLQLNIKGFQDSRVVSMFTDPMPAGKIKSLETQIRSSLTNMSEHFYIFRGRDDFIPTIQIDSINPRDPSRNSVGLLFYYSDAGWTSPFLPIGSVRNKNPDPTAENPGGDWLLVNNAPVLNDESEIDSYSYAYTYTDSFSVVHNATRDVSVKLQEYYVNTDKSRKVIDTAFENVI